MIVQARVFGKDRELQLTGRCGHHAVAKSCDDGPAVMTLLLASDVFPESITAFMEFMRRREVGAVECAD